MRARDVVDLLLLAALWGGSFLFMRAAAPVFGPVPLIAVRVGIAALTLLPVLAARGGLGALRGRVWPVLVTGAINSAIPFCLLAYATLFFTAGLASILNATSPLWGALVAHVWLRDRLTPSRALGLVLGFAGVAFLFWGRASMRNGGDIAIVAALAATASYGLAASYAKKRLAGMDPLAVAAGSQAAATLLLAVPAAAVWPEHPVPAAAWAAAGALGVASTAVAYVLYFRLIAHVGPTRAITVTFLIPPFAVAWGALFLDERVTAHIALGAGIVLVGTALATGIIRPPVKPRAIEQDGSIQASRRRPQADRSKP